MDVCNRDVVQDVHERHSPAGDGAALPEGLDRISAPECRFGTIARRPDAKHSGDRIAGPQAIVPCGSGRNRSGRTASAHDLPTGARGNECADPVAVGNFASCLRPEPDRGIPSPRNPEKVAVNGHAGAARSRGRDDPSHPPPALHVSDFVPAEDANAVEFRPMAGSGGRPRIDNRHHLDAGRLHVPGDFANAVIVGEQHRPASRPDAVAVDVALNRRCQHDPRPIIVGKHQHPLAGAGRDNQRPGPDIPLPFDYPRLLGAPLVHEHEIVLPHRPRLRTPEEPDPPGRCQFGTAFGGPIAAGHTVNLGAPPVQAASGPGSPVDKQDVRTGTRQRARRR